MTFKNISIGLVPIGEIPNITCKSIAAHILGYYNLDVDILLPLEEPAYAFDTRRLQYNAGFIITAIEDEQCDDYDKIVCVLDVDLFVPIMSYVFGEARQGGRCALVSTYRLKKNVDGSSSPLSLQLERAGKVAIHELGHLFDLHHCMDEQCIMHFSGGLQALDEAYLNHCRYCSLYLRDALRKHHGAEGKAPDIS